MRAVLLLMLLCLARPVLADEKVDDRPPPMPSDAPAAVPDEVPEIRIIEKKDATYAEYRLRGKLYQVKVTPKIGKPYYLVDPKGDGNFIRRDGTEGIAVPRWVLFEF